MSCIYYDCHVIYDYIIVCFFLATGKDSAYNNILTILKKHVHIILKTLKYRQI